MRKRHYYSIQIALIFAAMLILFTPIVVIYLRVRDESVKVTQSPQVETEQYGDDEIKEIPVYSNSNITISKYLAPTVDEPDEPLYAYRLSGGDCLLEIMAFWDVEGAMVKIGNKESLGLPYGSGGSAACKITNAPLETKQMEDYEQKEIEAAFSIAGEALKLEEKIKPLLGENVIGALKKVAARQISATYSRMGCGSSVELGFRGSDTVRTYSAYVNKGIHYRPSSYLSLQTYRDKVLLNYRSLNDLSYQMVQYWDGSRIKSFIEKDNKLPEDTALPKYVLDDLGVISTSFEKPDGIVTDESMVADVKRAVNVIQRKAKSEWQEAEFYYMPMTNLESIMGESDYPKASPDSYTLISGEAEIGDYKVSAYENVEVWGFNFDVGNDYHLEIMQLSSGVIECNFDRDIGAEGNLSMVVCSTKLKAELPSGLETMLQKAQGVSTNILNGVSQKPSLLPKECVNALHAITNRMITLETFRDSSVYIHEEYLFIGPKAVECIYWEEDGGLSDGWDSFNTVTVDIAITPNMLCLTSQSMGKGEELCGDLELRFQDNLVIRTREAVESKDLRKRIRWIAQQLRALVKHDSLDMRSWSEAGLLRLLEYLEKHDNYKADEIGDVNLIRMLDFDPRMRSILSLPPE